jgi:hypothetical protein
VEKCVVRVLAPRRIFVLPPRRGTASNMAGAIFGGMLIDPTFVGGWAGVSLLNVGMHSASLSMSRRVTTELALMCVGGTGICIFRPYCHPVTGKTAHWVGPTEKIVQLTCIHPPRRFECGF